MLETLRELVGNRYAVAGLLVVGGLIGGWIAAFVIERTVGVLVRRTETDLDDKIMEALHRPLVLSVVLFGLALAVDVLKIPDKPHAYTISALKTVAIFVWARAGFRSATLFLHVLTTRAKKNDIIQPRTLPVFDMVFKIVIVGAAVYFIFLAWKIDLTAWLASAGVVGIAVGFAAKDTLANLFSGIFIVADAPYKVGDYIVLDGGLRGRVTSIGIRSTRILTLDDIEITIPNAVIGSSKIINEAGGPQVHQRLGVTVDAAYGCDIDRVHEVLGEVAEGVPHVLKDPKPVVRFTAFGGSGLTHVLYVWIDDAHVREKVAHELHTRIYKAFEAAGLEIPYSKHDVYIKEQPPLRAAS